ncbi:MAG TPA: hypothetical protein VIH29_01470 [Gallionella sp.]
MLAQRQARGTWSNENFIGYGENSGPLDPEGLSTFFESDAEIEWLNRMAELGQELEDIRTLPDNWDGEGAEAPKAELVDSAIDLLSSLQSQRTLPPPTRIAASPAGNIILEWQLEHSVYLEAEIVEPFRVEWMLELPFHPTRHWEESWMPAYAKKQRSQGLTLLVVR